MKRKIFSVLFAVVLVCSFSLMTAVPVGAVAPGAPTIDGVLDEGEWDDYYLGTSVTAWEGGMSVDVYGFADDTYLYAAYVADMAQPGWSVGAGLCVECNFNYWTPSTTEWPDPGHTLLAAGGNPDEWPWNVSQTDGSDWVGLPGSFDDHSIAIYSGDGCYNTDPNPNVAEVKIPLSLLTYAGDNHFIGLGGQYWQYDFAEPLLVMLPPSPTTVWVDDGWVGFDIGDPADGHTFGYDAFATIQGGINGVSPTGTVNVEAGEYGEHVVIDKQLTLLGANHDVNPVTHLGERGDESIIDGTELTGGGGLVQIKATADGIVFKGFTVRESLYSAGGIYVETESENSVYENNIVADNGNTAFFCVGDGNFIRNNVISDNRHSGEIGQINLQMYTDDCIIENNAISGGGWIQIMLWNVGDGNIVQNNIITGIGLDEYTERPTMGILLSDGGIGNIVRGNTVAPEEGSPGFDMAIDVAGARFGGLNTLVEDNTIHNNVIGVKVTGGVDATLVKGNDIQGNECGILVTSNAINTHINHNNIVDNTIGVLNEISTTVDATSNWWGTTTELEIAGMVSGDVNYLPWLPAPFDQIVEGAVDSAPVSGSDPGPEDLQDDDNNTIAIVDISGAPGDADGTIIASRYIGEPTEPTTSLSVGTGATGVVFLDVKVTGYTEGWAHITVPYTPADVVDVEEEALGLYYWDATAPIPTWRLAKNSAVDTSAKTVSGGIPVSALTGTPIGLGGYEALVAIESILNLSNKTGTPSPPKLDTVKLTIKTNTAFLEAATIDLTFDPNVVEVLGFVEGGVDGEDSAFDFLEVNPNYAVWGSDMQVARFLAYQGIEADVDARDGAVVAVVKLQAVGSTMDFSPLHLDVITLKDNNLDRIPRTVGAPSFALVGGVGDANRDTYVDSDDLVYIERAILGILGYSIDAPTMNVDAKDGVDAADCAYLAQHLIDVPDRQLPPDGWMAPWGPWAPPVPPAP